MVTSSVFRLFYSDPVGVTPGENLLRNIGRNIYFSMPPSQS